jgi:hypothetical protein
MGEIVDLDHARASADSRAAKAVKRSADTAPSLARSVKSSAAQYSAGILSRCHHLRTAGKLTPISEAKASCESQSLMTSLNEAISDMPVSLGQFVPKSNANVSTDNTKLSGHSVPMEDEDEKLAETQWREEFRKRIIEARGGRKQAVMAELLGILTNTYGKYEAESRKSVMPVRLLPRFAKICGVDLVELIEGPRKAQTPTKPRLVKPVDKPQKRA